MSDSSSVTHLAQLLHSRVQDGQRVRFTVTPDWLQGRTTFGGLLSLLAVQAMRDVDVLIPHKHARRRQALEAFLAVFPRLYVSPGPDGPTWSLERPQ